MKASIIALATAAALSMGASGVALAQDTTTTNEVIEGCPINTEGVHTESGVATPAGESLVSEDDSDEDSISDQGEIPVDECEDGALGQGVIEGTSNADSD